MLFIHLGKARKLGQRKWSLYSIDLAICGSFIFSLCMFSGSALGWKFRVSFTASMIPTNSKEPEAVGFTNLEEGEPTSEE